MTTLADINKTLERIEKSDDVNQALLGRIGIVMDEQLRLLRQQRNESEKSELLGLEASREAQRQTLARQIGQRQDVDGLEGVEIEQGAFRGSLFGNLLRDMAAPLTGLLSLMGLRQLESATGRVRRGVGLGRMLGGAALVAAFLPQIQALGEAIGTFVGEKVFDGLSEDNQEALNKAMGEGVATALIGGPLAGLLAGILSFGVQGLVVTDAEGNVTLKNDIPGLNKEMENAVAGFISSPAFSIIAGLVLARVGQGLVAALGSFAVGLPAAAAASLFIVYKQFTDEDFAKQLEDLTEPVRNIFRSIGSFFSRSIISIGRAIRDKLFRTTEVTQEEKDLTEQLDSLISERKKLVADQDINVSSSEFRNLPITIEIEQISARLKALRRAAAAAGNEEIIKQMRDENITQYNRSLGLGTLSASELEEARAFTRARAATSIQELINAQRAAADINSGTPGGFMVDGRQFYDNSQQTAQSIFMSKSTALDEGFSWSFGPQRPFGR